MQLTHFGVNIKWVCCGVKGYQNTKTGAKLAFRAENMMSRAKVCDSYPCVYLACCLALRRLPLALLKCKLGTACPDTPLLLSSQLRSRAPCKARTQNKPCDPHTHTLSVSYCARAY